MKDEDLNSLLTLTKNKRDTLKEILNLTKNKKFKASEEEISNFQIFLNERKRFFNIIGSIENNIKCYDVSNVKSDNLIYREVEKINTEIKDMIKQIIILDKNNRKIMDEVMANIKDNLRISKVGQKVNKGYSYANLSYSGSFFDSKQ